jgi:hypothetical protein
MSAERDTALEDWEAFARRHLALLVTVLLRVVTKPASAFDLAVETLATLRRRWGERPLLRELRRSPLVHAEALPDHERQADGA